MDTVLNKAQWLQRIDDEAAIWEALLAEVGEARMETPGATGSWTFKDVTGHLIGWRKRTVNRLAAAATDAPPPPAPWEADLPGEVDTEEATNAVNDWIYAQNRDRPLAEVLAESRLQFAQMRELVAALPEEALTDPNRYPWIAGDPLSAVLSATFEHLHEEHDPPLRAWLAGPSGGDAG